MAHFTFPIDADFAAKNNELLKDTKRLQLSAGLFGIIQILIGVGLYFWLGGAFGIICLAVFAIMALISFAMIFVVPKQVGNAQHLYDNYDLVPAMIAEVNPRDMVVMALVNTNVDPTLPPPMGTSNAQHHRNPRHRRRHPKSRHPYPSSRRHRPTLRGEPRLMGSNFPHAYRMGYSRFFSDCSGRIDDSFRTMDHIEQEPE